MENNFQVNDTVFILEPYTGDVIRCTVSTAGADHRLVPVRCHAAVNEKGEDVTPVPGCTSRMADEVWASAEAAFQARDARDQARFEAYCKQMETKEDALRFPTRHCLFGGEEHTDPVACRAYVHQVKALFGIDL